MEDTLLLVGEEQSWGWGALICNWGESSRQRDSTSLKEEQEKRGEGEKVGDDDDEEIRTVELLLLHDRHIEVRLMEILEYYSIQGKLFCF